jgi:hypothetical protein
VVAGDVVALLIVDGEGERAALSPGWSGDGPLLVSVSTSYSSRARRSRFTLLRVVLAPRLADHHERECYTIAREKNPELAGMMAVDRARRPHHKSSASHHRRSFGVERAGMTR